MDFKLLLIISLTMAHVNGDDRPEGKRLIKRNLTYKVANRMSKQEMKNLGFMELTRVRRDEVADVSGGRATVTESVPNAPIFSYKYRDNLIHQNVIRSILPHLDKSRMEEVVKKLSKFYSRYAGGKEFSGSNQAEGWLTNEIKAVLADYPVFQAFTIPDSTLEIEGDKEEGRPYYQENIIVTLPGHDPTLNSELIILSAHFDSAFGFTEKEWKSRTGAPGANDNATGVAVLLEVLRLIAKFGIKLKHTIEFHFYTAKETELRGSQDVVKKYKEEGKRVKGVLNLDSLGYVSGNSKGRSLTADVTDAQLRKKHTNPALTAFVEMLVKSYLDVVRQKKVARYRQAWFSDHYSWTLAGYPAAFATEYGTSPHFHTTDDVISNVNFEMVNEFAKLGLAFMIELGELSETPVIPTSFAGNQKVGLSLFGICMVVNLLIILP